jgi:RNA polymerase sigma-70 factor (ECF subfamily)
MDSTPVSLLERLQSPSDPEAWDRFVSLYTPLVYSWGRRVGLHDQDAADLVQEVFVTLVQVMPTFTYDRQRSFRRWLRTVTLNKWRDRQKRRGDQPLAGDAERLAQEAVPDPLEAFWEVEYRQQLAGRAIQIMQTDFQPTTWKAFWEHVVVGRPAPEVAAEIGLTPGAVYAAKLRVLDRLREALAGMLD